ncbi:DUF6389 family protein [Nonlabens sp.]|uniref:DUF6389 family protein n=1 Tax=Nonlabens sp. TaxID=1888209 RepID=UPI0032646284
MTEKTYEEELYKSFDKEKVLILKNLNSFLRQVPPEAIRVNIIISPNQEGDGSFCIHGGLNGPNLYVLNKQVEDWNTIIVIKNTSLGFDLDFPMLDPFSLDFYANDVIDQVFIKWFDDHWNEIDDSKITVAISIYSDHI